MRSGACFAVTARILLVAGVVLAGISGCGTPGAPLPPSLDLPQPVSDLAASRAGDRVTLRWTNPQKTTDHQGIAQATGKITARICRSVPDPPTSNAAKAGDCQSIETLSVVPGKQAEFADTLPAALAGGSPRPLLYAVEVLNRRGRSAGLSEPAVVLAGAAPPAVENLSAQARAEGVALGWQTDDSRAAVRLHRRLLTPTRSVPAKSTFGQQAEEAPERDLIVDIAGVRSTPGAHAGALDRDIRFGQRYQYTAQRVVFVTMGGKNLELDGAVSAPVQVDTTDRFPPAIPSGLAAVYSAATGARNSVPSINLSWSPDTETDLAGYIVYRSADGPTWQRISPPEPVSVPTWQDSKISLGQTYHYAVSAIDQSGNESGRSAPATESVPENP